MNISRLGVLLLCVTCADAALANETPPYIKRSPELSQVAARYSAWLKETGISSPAPGWEVNVLGLDAITCTGLSPQSASSALHEDGIDCTKPDVPQFILRLNFMHPEKIWHDADDGWAKLNDSFKDAHGVTLDERLIVKISHLLSIRSKDVRISMQTYCKRWLSQFHEGTVKKVWGEACMMAGSSTLITSGITQALRDSNIPSSSNSFGGNALTGELILRFLDADLGKKGAIIKRLNSDSNYAEATIERLRGEVIELQKYWERLQASFIISKKGNAHEVRLLLDGQYAAGINQPPLSAYSDMEPAHSKSLQLYADSILARLKAKLTAGESK
ncbi:MAG: hypothetical protein P9E88_14365 [Candidatus Competibacter sp.]|nr:hypothetical protein [Candidatus Competibacter sp.]